MTVSGARARRRLACAGVAVGALCSAVLPGIAGGAATPADARTDVQQLEQPGAVRTTPVASGPPPRAVRDVGRNPFLPLTGPVGDRPERVLRQGDTGEDVRRVQQALARRTAADRGGEPVVDGLFGPRTSAAVIAFQSAHGLPADGVVGERTRDALLPASGR